MNVLKAQNLGKQYQMREVVKDVSLQIESGEVVGLLGPNGAGKTTSFYMIVGLIRSDKGQITLNDHEITHYPMHTRAQEGIGYLPQEASIFRKLTVAQNILAILELRRDLTHQQRMERLEHLMHEFHISHLHDVIGISLSGGERRRVEIARALALEPKFMLLDEPFAGIDPISVVDIKRVITHLRDRDIGILITDHNVRETLAICNRAYIVNAGEIICQGSPKEILANQKVREVYLGHEFDL